MSAPVTVNGFYKVHGVKVTPTHPTHTHTHREALVAAGLLDRTLTDGPMRRWRGREGGHKS